jgi:hypothetical protein
VQALTEGGQSGPSGCPSIERQEPRWSRHPRGPSQGPAPQHLCPRPPPPPHGPTPRHLWLQPLPHGAAPPPPPLPMDMK